MRVQVRVFAARNQQTKSGKQMWRQQVQYDQSDAPAYVSERVYFKEEGVLQAGDYTAALRVYPRTVKNSKGFDDHFGVVSFADFQAVKGR